MQQEDRNPSGNITKWYYKLKHIYKTVSSSDYRNFRKYEHPVLTPKNVNDITNLRYMRTIDMAKNGYVGPDLKSKLHQVSLSNQLVMKDRSVVQIGKIQVMDKNARLADITLGYDEKTKKLKISSSKVDNIPLWKNYDQKYIDQAVKPLYPTNANALRLEHRTFNEDIKRLEPNLRQKVRASFNRTISMVHKSNPKLANSVQNVTVDEFRLGKYDAKRPVVLPQLNNKPFMVSNSTDHYVILRPYLKSSNRDNTVMMSKKEFEAALSHKNVTVLGHSQRGITVGMENDKLMVRVKDDMAVDKGLKKWNTVNDFLAATNVPESLKYDLTNTMISKKNFLDETSSHTFKHQGSTYVVKQHYGSKEKFIAPVNGDRSKIAAHRFKPLSVILKSHPDIEQAYRASRKRGHTFVPRKTNNKSIKR